MNEEKYEVEAILGEKVDSGNTLFLVKWANYTEEENSWVAEKDLECEDLIEKFRKEARESRVQSRGPAREKALQVAALRKAEKAARRRAELKGGGRQIGDQPRRKGRPRRDDGLRHAEAAGGAGRAEDQEGALLMADDEGGAGQAEYEAGAGQDEAQMDAVLMGNDEGGAGQAEDDAGDRRRVEIEDGAGQDDAQAQDQDVQRMAQLEARNAELEARNALLEYTIREIRGLSDAVLPSINDLGNGLGPDAGNQQEVVMMGNDELPSPVRCLLHVEYSENREAVLAIVELENGQKVAIPYERLRNEYMPLIADKVGAPFRNQ